MNLAQQVAIGRTIKESGIVNRFPDAPSAFGDGRYVYVIGSERREITVDDATFAHIMREYGIEMRGDARLTRLVCALHALGKI